MMAANWSIFLVYIQQRTLKRMLWSFVHHIWCSGVCRSGDGKLNGNYQPFLSQQVLFWPQQRWMILHIYKQSWMLVCCLNVSSLPATLKLETVVYLDLRPRRKWPWMLAKFGLCAVCTRYRIWDDQQLCLEAWLLNNLCWVLHFGCNLNVHTWPVHRSNF